MKLRSHSEMIKMGEFLERFDYLKLGGLVGADTFGFDRYLNQRFYKSREWASSRDAAIIRDNGCDLGIEGREIYGRILIHHMNPISPEDIVNFNDDILNPEFLVCVTHRTHNAIHYGDESLLLMPAVERQPGDTTPWKVGNLR